MSTVERPRVQLVILSSIPLAVGSGIAASVLTTPYIGEVVGQPQEMTLGALVIQAVVSTVLGAAVVLLLSWALRRHRHLGRRLVVAFVVSPLTYAVSLFIGQAFLLLMFKGATSVAQGILLVVSLGVSMLALILVLIDALPPAVRNLFVIFYGSVFGTFLGIITVTSSIAVIVTTLVVEDYLIVRHSRASVPTELEGHVGVDPFDYTRVQTRAAAVGVGDYVVFSLLAAHTLVYFPPFVWLMSVVLMLTGISVNVFVLARPGRLLPGIPLPSVLALFPWAVHYLGLVLLA